MGHVADVQDALEHIRTAYFQVAARFYQPSSAYAVNWTSDSVPQLIRLMDYSAVRVIKCPPQLPQPGPSTTVSSMPRADPKAVTVAADQLNINSRLVVEAATQSLNRLRFYQGHLRFRVHLGSFCLQNYMAKKGQVYEIEEFETMLADPQFIGSVTGEYVIAMFCVLD